MTAILTQKELIEAVKEWCEKRGIPVPGDEIEFVAKFDRGYGAHTIVSSSDSYEFGAKVLNLIMGPKNGPYR